MASGADRISDLPEGVLHHILSLLPAQDAVRTCVLTQSWRHHWRSAPAVRFVGCAGWAGGVYTFGPFVDGLLSARRGGAPLDSCDFDLDVDLDLGPYDVPKMERHVNGWIRRALRRQVRDLRFRVSVTPRLPCALEDRSLASEHLTRLELVGVKGNAGVLDFSCCPALEDLRMEDCDVGSTEMHSPSLKRLRIRYCLFYCNFRTGMSLPSLVSFEFITNAGRVPMLESMPSLETATVRFDHFYDDRCSNGRLDDCGDAACYGCYYYYAPDDYDCVFLEGLTEVTDLTLSAYPDLCANLVPPPRTSSGETYSKPSKVRKHLMRSVGSYKALERTIAASHLQIVEIICKDVDEILLKILKVLNANGIPQEKIRIQCSALSAIFVLAFEQLCMTTIPCPNSFKRLI
ncbi:F-box/LRR-repeat protein [Panicum miliaceum]|uniref:F-box/LRR-repeat protein n=1 Tax=Panicum miliaceum TaxID=4540 RepID=A0A3L6Q2W3_PANMI|nr:F-box/LRR-repeat protein [Panicum miliaceum]